MPDRSSRVYLVLAHDGRPIRAYLEVREASAHADRNGPLASVISVPLTGKDAPS